MSRLVRLILWLILLAPTAWAFGALWFDFPVKTLREAVAIAYALTTIVVFFALKNRWRAQALVAAGFAIVLTWWLTRRRHQSLTRRQKVLIWAIALGIHVPKSSPLKSLYSTIPR